MAIEGRTTLAASLAEDAATRLIRDAKIDTQPDEDSETSPSTEGQLVLLRLLRDELEEIGLTDAAIDGNGYVTATLPSTADREVPTIALFAHLDTAPEAYGKANPQRMTYDGGEIELGTSGQVIRPSESP